MNFYPKLERIDVCICTHNPRLEVLSIVLTALANQTLSKDAYQVWIIDNASDPPISDRELAPLADAGVTYHLLQELRLGTMYARELASQAIPGDALILVDDDNELLPNYLEVAIDILDRHPEIGYFGGKLLSGIQVNYPQWMEELLPYLGIKDEGDEPISQRIEGDYYWGKWEPPGAGAVVRKVVLQKYFDNVRQLPPDLVIGRRGKQGLLSMADSWIAYCAYELGLQCSYQPQLALIHHIDPTRLQLEYLVRLMYNYGRSHVIFRQILNRPIQPGTSASNIPVQIERWKKNEASTNYLIFLLIWEAGYHHELFRDDKQFDFISLMNGHFTDILQADINNIASLTQQVDRIPYVQQQNHSLEAQTISLQTQITSLQQQSQSLQEQNQLLQSQAATSEEQNHFLQVQVATSEEQNHFLQAQATSLQEHAESLQQQIISMDNDKFGKLRQLWMRLKKTANISS
jgi:glycosyltransferase involved in cell wall biosynthesis